MDRASRPYNSLDAAKKACLQKPSCKGVVDSECDGDPLFFTCFTDVLTASSQHSCVYSKVDAATINKCTCTNGAPNIKFKYVCLRVCVLFLIPAITGDISVYLMQHDARVRCPRDGAKSCARCIPGFHLQKNWNTGYMVCVKVQQTTGPGLSGIDV